MRTVIVIGTRGFGAFRRDLLHDPDGVRFVGIFSTHDEPFIPAAHRDLFSRVAVLPCGKADPTAAESSLVDVDGARRVIGEVLAAEPRRDVTLHSFDERNLLLTAGLREEFGLPGPRYADILPFRDKLIMKELVRTAGIRVPAFGEYDAVAAAEDPARYFDRIVAEVGLPFVLKPVDGNSSDGVYRIDSADDHRRLPAELGWAYEYEEFIDGTMYSVNIISRDGRPVFAGVTEYLVNSAQVQQGRVNVDVNLIDSDPRVPRMIAFGEAALDALGRPDGASHLELFRTAADELVFLEVAARFKGMAGVAAMQRNYGVALVNLALEIEGGPASRPYDGERVYCYDGVIPKRAGTVEHLVEPDIESEYEMTWKVRPGQVIGHGESLSDNGGVFLVWNKDYDAAYRDFRRFADYRPVVYRTN
jgi:ATP-grasp domain